jgi:hypothetical protein
LAQRDPEGRSSVSRPTPPTPAAPLGDAPAAALQPAVAVPENASAEAEGDVLVAEPQAPAETTEPTEPTDRADPPAAPEALTPAEPDVAGVPNGSPDAPPPADDTVVDDLLPDGPQPDRPDTGLA